jgi:hypothetical protein
LPFDKKSFGTVFIYKLVQKNTLELSRPIIMGGFANWYVDTAAIKKKIQRYLFKSVGLGVA